MHLVEAIEMRSTTSVLSSSTTQLRTSATTLTISGLSIQPEPKEDQTPKKERTHTFGALIANTDRHLGNLSLFANLAGNIELSLAPAYDMLPMAYRPTDQGEIRTVEFRPPTPAAASADVWSRALQMQRLVAPVSG